MHLPRLLAAVLALTAASAAHAATGSGTVSFQFTQFEGPYGAADLSVLNDPSLWLLTGEVNGSTPTPNGVTSPAFGNTVYVGGTQALYGDTVSMGYTNLPGAIESVISFSAASFSNVSTGQDFLLGTLSYTNGQWVGGSGNPLTNYPVSLGFRLTTSSATPEFNQVFEDVFTVVTNQGSGACSTRAEQQSEADFIYIAGLKSLGSMRVFDQACKPAGESNMGTVELWGHFGSLHLDSFRNPGGSAFLVDTTGVGPIGGVGVPEPGAWALMLAGFGLAGAALRRRRAQRLPWPSSTFTQVPVTASDAGETR